MLYELSQSATAEPGFARPAREMHRDAARVLRADNMIVVHYDERRPEFERVLRVVAGVPDPGSAPRRYPVGHGLMTPVVGERCPIRTSNYTETCRSLGVEPALVPAGCPYWLGVPMIMAERVLGGLALWSAEAPFSEADEQLLGSIANIATLVLSIRP